MHHFGKVEVVTERNATVAASDRAEKVTAACCILIDPFSRPLNKAATANRALRAEIATLKRQADKVPGLTRKLAELERPAFCQLMMQFAFGAQIALSDPMRHTGTKAR